MCPPWIYDGHGVIVSEPEKIAHILVFCLTGGPDLTATRLDRSLVG